MASEVDIANLALAHLGDDATVSSFDPPEGSAQAEHCARFYPIARDTLLEMHAWTFATCTAALVEVDWTVDGWDYAYAVPNLCLSPLQLYAPGYRTQQPGDPFVVEVDDTGQGVILTNTADAILRYVLAITEPERFSNQFVDALGWLLASMLAGPIIKGETGAKIGEECWKVFQARLGSATTQDANSGITPLDSTAPWITVRGRANVTIDA